MNWYCCFLVDATIIKFWRAQCLWNSPQSWRVKKHGYVSRPPQDLSWCRFAPLQHFNSFSRFSKSDPFARAVLIREGKPEVELGRYFLHGKLVFFFICWNYLPFRLSKALILSSYSYQRTEVIPNTLSPSWTIGIRLDYHFEELQTIRIEVIWQASTRKFIYFS